MSIYSTIFGSEGRYQSAVPKQMEPSAGFLRANGLLLRGVVTATYVADDPKHPQVLNNPIAIYCDVLTYSGTSTTKWRGLKSVLVSQDIGGMQRGNIWKPRPTTMSINNLPVNPDAGPNPALWDGDHVLVGFMDDNLNEPIILRGIPHPSADAGNELKSVGNRLKLKVLDGDPSFWKHHGSYFGVKDNGDYVVDTTWANSGTLLTSGNESNPPVDGSGSQLHNLPKDAQYSIVFNDMTSPMAPVSVCELNLTETQFQVLITSVNNLLSSGSGPSASLQVGNGAKSVAIADNLETMYSSLKGKLDLFDSHTHIAPPGGGTTSGPVPTIGAPSWDSDINSTQLTIPANP